MSNYRYQHCIRFALLLTLILSAGCQKSSHTLSLKGSLYGDKINARILPQHPIHLKNAVLGHIEDLKIATDKDSRQYIEMSFDIDATSFKSLNDPVLLITNITTGATTITIIARQDLSPLQSNEELAEILSIP